MSKIRFYTAKHENGMSTLIPHPVVKDLVEKGQATRVGRTIYMGPWTLNPQD